MKAPKTRTLIGIGIGALVVLLGSAAAWYVSTPLVTFHDHGSTNGSGYTITVYRNGRATFACDAPGGRSSYLLLPCSSVTLPPGSVQVSQFILDGEAAGDIAQIRPLSSCMKSVSFGSVMTMTYHGVTSGDISCYGYAPRYNGIIDDANQMATKVLTSIPKK